MSETKSTGEAMVGALVREGVDTVFGIPGAQTYELFDALGRASDQIRVLAPRHEQAASYMAFGYARSTGRTGVYSVVPGPGVLNSSAGLCTAYGASAPVVCLTSEVPSPYIGVTTLLIRGFDPLEDAVDYGRRLLPLVRQEVARRDSVAVA